MKRGEVYLADLSPVQGSEQGGKRPVVIIQNNVGNYHSPTVIVAAITGRINKAKIPTHVEISKDTYNLDKDSVILLEQIRTVDKKRLREKLTYLNEEKMKEVDKALMVSLDLMPSKSKSKKSQSKS
ncbi:type II toxin-antitoxin system PemK/MazF family toxin [Salinicoccus roseus]|jgi:mRNA interferase MazF|uniref:mRNA interferase n=1 Tax=Salinicoccus roseus TaxID=45670 RepID=A0A265E8H0_9STAP|nr:type II toxin-antitoxin system PemK/MazF family toxin [Salinicoccus roseus]MBY8910013.1 type II toxin-antitoxin system PemK/MazF family toxin [Salinicoccus roseus]MCG7333546.1 type II toxin-antitoxin system PemK/MazF family toxin [Salinicoccus roseus]OZT77706.1 PemK family transcriptional regulator [Salinicoccus roseus]RPE52685.1 mRNA interferase MazF [Salinicoccus roseus]GGA74216.1 endoribonuclease MazF [Salinicoccus roseus]|tara:strand:- start:647 stop:1024 length:378 start_codon:yes stop_codon:yes gene_type:complete